MEIVDPTTKEVSNKHVSVFIPENMKTFIDLPAGSKTKLKWKENPYWRFVWDLEIHKAE